MKLDEYLCWATASYFKASREGKTKILDHLKASYLLDTLYAPGFYSLGALWEGSPITFLDWIEHLALKDPISVSVGALRSPAPWESGFQGPASEVLQLALPQGSSSWQLSPFNNPPFLLTGELFQAWVDAQDHPETFWKDLEPQILDFLTSNNLGSLSLGEIQTHWQIPGVLEAYNFLAQDLCTQVQVTAYGLKQKVKIPPNLKEYFEGQPVESARDLPWKVYYYVAGEVTGTQLADLVQAQSWQDDVWKTCIEYAAMYPELESSPKNPLDWESWLRQASEDLTGTLGAMVLQVLNQESQGRKLIIPADLETYFGPSEEQAYKDALRNLIQDDGLILRSPDKGWIRYSWCPVSATPETLNFPLVLQEFKASLVRLEAFAEADNSPFAEAFRLGIYFLEAGDQMVNDPGTLADHEFSGRARSNVADRDHLVASALIFGESITRVNQMLALDLSDVFGGMGSWNDYTGPGDMDTHSRLSGEMFTWRKKFFQAFLSSNSP